MDAKERSGERKRTDGRAKEEIGATSGKTHAEVLDMTVGSERRLQKEAAAGAERDDEADR